MTEERIINLEIKFSHQEVFIMQLNEVVTHQGKIIERLEKEILDLKRNANIGTSVEGGRTLTDEKPPHY
jgi:SlyX protein